MLNILKSTLFLLTAAQLCLSGKMQAQNAELPFNHATDSSKVYTREERALYEKIYFLPQQEKPMAVLDSIPATDFDYDHDDLSDAMNSFKLGEPFFINSLQLLVCNAPAGFTPRFCFEQDDDKKYSVPIVEILSLHESYLSFIGGADGRDGDFAFYTENVPNARNMEYEDGGHIIRMATGMLISFNKDEFKAILAHEAWHTRVARTKSRTAKPTITEQLAEERAADKFAAENTSPAAIKSALMRLYSGVANSGEDILDAAHPPPIERLALIDAFATSQNTKSKHSLNLK